MSEAASQRLAALDGLRGWAALSVVAYHLTWECFGRLYPAIRSLPLALFTNGNLAVALFLMVSGYVLTIRGWRSDDKAGVRRSIVKRYFRLTIPILASVLIFWAVIALGWIASPAAGAIVDSPEWLQRFGNLEPDLAEALIFGLVIVYVHTGADGYGPFLWTMTIELWGSYLVLLLCLFELPRRWAYVPVALVTLLAIAGTWAPYLPIAACYPAGALVALLTKDGVFSGTPAPSESRIATWLFAATMVAAAVVEVLGGGVRVTAVLAMVAFVAALRSGPVSRFLSRPVSQWLGQVSFPLYLLQIVVIVTLTSALIVAAHDAGLLTPWTAAAIAAVSLAACLVLARLFMPIERFSLSFSARIGARAKA